MTTTAALSQNVPVSRRRQLVADGSLATCTLVWGLSFVLIKDAVNQVSPLLFLAVRFTLAALALAVFAVIGRRWRGITLRETAWGLLVGVLLWLGYGTQTIGLQWTTASNGGFITGLSVVLVPIFGIFLLGQRPDRWSWVGVVLATLGLGLLSVHFVGGLRVNPGDPLILVCAVAFAFQIVLVARVAPSSDPLRLALVQIATAGLLFGISAAVVEGPTRRFPTEVWATVTFLGVLGTGVALVVQAAVQRFTTAVHTALIFTLEPVFAAAFGTWLQGDRLTAAGLAGAALILAGMLVAEIGPGVGAGRVARVVEPTAAFVHQVGGDLPSSHAE